MNVFKMTIISFISVLFLNVTCTNPTMENGFSKLDEALANLAAAIEQVNIGQIQADIESIDADLANMTIEIEKMNGSWDELITGLAEVHNRLGDILDNSGDWATAEDWAIVAQQIADVRKGVETLVLLADYDYDGVINALDKCPNTPLDQINNVDAQGCAPNETQESNG